MMTSWYGVFLYLSTNLYGLDQEGATLSEMMWRFTAVLTYHLDRE